MAADKLRDRTVWQRFRRDLPHSRGRGAALFAAGSPSWTKATEPPAGCRENIVSWICSTLWLSFFSAPQLRAGTVEWPRARSFSNSENALRQRTAQRRQACTVKEGTQPRASCRLRLTIWNTQATAGFATIDSWIRMRLRSHPSQPLQTPRARACACRSSALATSASSRRMGCFPCHRPMPLAVSPWRGDSSTGEPDAGDPPVRFGGRGERNQSFLPTPIALLLLSTAELSVSSVNSVLKRQAQRGVTVNRVFTTKPAQLNWIPVTMILLR